MNYQLILKSGEIINMLGASINTGEVTAFLNNPNVMFANFGDMILHKEEIRRLIPIKKEEQSEQTQAEA